MTEMRVTYSAAADRWEGFPVTAGVTDIRDVDGVRLLIGVAGDVVGFAFDADGLIESRIEVLGRYLEVESFEDRLRAPISTDDETVVDVRSRGVALVTPVRSSSVVVRGMREPSHWVGATVVESGIVVRVRFAWWFSLWGIWCTVARGDGLVLADRPVSRRATARTLPNAFPVRAGDVRVRLRRGPRTVRRAAGTLLSALIVGAILVGASGGDDARTGSPVPTTVTDEAVVTTPAPTPTISLPVGRAPATDYVSADGSARLDVAVNATEAEVGGVVEVTLSFDKSAINPFGVVGADGNQNEAFRSCQANLDLYREVPMQPGASEQFRVYLVDANGDRTLLPDVFQPLQLVGAMVEGCPAPVDVGGGPYLILQRTFYAPLVLSMSVPDRLPAGEYDVRVEVGAQQWETATPVTVAID